MTKHQAAIFEEGNAHHLFLEFTAPSLGGRLPGRNLLQRPTPRVYEAFAFSAKALDAIDHRHTPEDLIDFTSIEGDDGLHAPATQGDIFIWIQSNQRDEVFARGLAWTNALQEVASIAQESLGFLYRDSRDLTGFIVGRANPRFEERFDTALIPDGPHAGGSFVMTQRWQHNLAKFHALDVETQERVIGRTKKSSEELTGEHFPANSHRSRTAIKRHDQAVNIYRRSTPTGGMQNPGLFFLAFSAELRRFSRLLDSMYGTTEDGVRDQLLDFSTPLTGSFYYAPTLNTLNRVFD